MLLRCFLIVMLLAFASGCGTSPESPPEKQPDKQAESTALPATVQNEESESKTPTTQIIESTTQAQNPETQELYEELDKELNELKNVLDSLETVDDNDLSRNL